jgi:hypothetical protein
MLIFIDDSGDPGFKLDKGSSQYFVIACIIFNNNLDAEETALNIKRLRQNLKWRQDHEFKFNKANRDIRTQFLKEVRNCNFRVRAIIVDKKTIRSPELKGSKNSFYNYVIKEVLSKDGFTRDAKVRLDGHENRTYKKAAMAYFRKHLSTIDNFKFVDSKSDNLIQLADMVAGSIFRSLHNSKAGNQDYLKIIAKRIEDIWDFK